MAGFGAGVTWALFAEVRTGSAAKAWLALREKENGKNVRG